MVKKLSRRLVAALLVLMLLVPVFAIPASAASDLDSVTLTWGTTKVTVTGSKTNKNYPGEMTYNDDEKWIKFSGAGYTAKGRNSKNTISLDMMIPKDCVLEFDYHETLTGEFTTKAVTYSPNGTSQNVVLEDGIHATIGAGEADTKVYWTYQVNGENNSFEVTLDNITLTISGDYNVTINSAEHGSLTADSESVPAGGSLVKAVSSSKGVILSASPDSGYTFAGYSVNGSDVYMGSSSTDVPKTIYQYSYFPGAEATITPVFIPKSESAFLVGDVLRGYRLTDTFADAVEFARQNHSAYIITLTDSTVPEGDYAIPSGTTVVIPNDIANSVYTDSPNVLVTSSTSKAYVKLTLESGANLSFEDGAAMSIAGNLFAPGAGKATAVTGDYGQLIVSEGAQVTFGDGAKLYAWGFATGEGEIECLSGAEAHEMFQINDFAGGTISLNLVQDGRAFPFSQYYVQNVECMLRINAGATEIVFGSVYAGSATMSTELTFIGDSSSLFAVFDGSVVKYYDDEQDKLICRIEGDAAINPINVSFAQQNIDSSKYQLPISNIGVEIASGSTVSITQDLQILPDSSVTVDNGATLTINSEIYLIDADDWNGGSHVYNQVNCRPLVYSATRYDKYGSGSSSRTSTGSTASAMLDNNGAIIIDEGTLNTTPGGAVITSSEGTGSIENINNFQGYELVLLDFSSGSSIENLVTEDEPETVCADFDNPDTSGSYRYDSARDVWYTSPVSVYFEKDGEIIAGFEDVDYDSAITPPDATKENTPQKKYIFIGWRSSVDNELYQPEDITVALKNVTYTAEYTETDSVYTVIWKNDDGTVLETDADVPYGEMPEYNGDTPAKAAEGSVTYTFKDWSPAVAQVIGDVTYTATYTQNAPSYPTTHSLSLEGQIHVNFYWQLPDGEDSADYSVTFSFMGETSDETGLALTDYGYKTAFAVDAPEMTCDIIATLYYKGNPVATDTYKPAQYAKDKCSYTESATELEIDRPYLIGKINGSVNWSEPSPSNLLTLNTAAEGTEYMIQNVPLTAGDEIKVVIYKGDNTYWWYPNGDNNNYEITQNGVYNIYFRADDYQADGWWYDHLRVETVSTDNAVYQSTLLPTLLQATLNYGAKAQANFNIKGADPADDAEYLSYKGVFGEVTQDMLNAKLGDSATRDLYTDMDVFHGFGLDYYGSSLVMNSNTKIKLYYGVEDKALFEANMNGFIFGDQAVTPTYASSDVVCFTLDGIAAVDLNTRYTLQNGSVSASYAALDYAALCMDDKDSDPNLYNLIQALYWYNVYADAYFG